MMRSWMRGSGLAAVVLAAVLTGCGPVDDPSAEGQVPVETTESNEQGIIYECDVDSDCPRRSAPPYYYCDYQQGICVFC